MVGTTVSAIPSARATGSLEVRQFKALFQIGKLRLRAATLGLSQSNQRIGGPARTLTWASGWSSGMDQTRAGGGPTVGGQQGERPPWLPTGCSAVKEELPWVRGRGHYHGKAAPRPAPEAGPWPGVDSALRHRGSIWQGRGGKNCYQIYKVLLCLRTFICIDPVNEKIVADASLSQRIMRTKR